MVAPLIRLYLSTALALVLLAPLPCSVPRPDVVLLLLAPTALRGGRVAGAWFGFGGGLLLGLVGTGNPGVLAGVYGLVGLTLGLLGEEGGGGGFFMQGLALVIGTVLVGLALALLGGLGAPEVAVLRNWLPRALVVNLVLAWPARVLSLWALPERSFHWRGLPL